MAREIQDASLKVSAALPNAANTVNSNIIDLGATTPFPVTEQIGIRIAASTGTQANSKNINITLQHSADSNVSNFTNITELRTLVVPGNTTAVTASQFDLQLPPGTKRYVRAIATGEANGGNSADGTFTVSLQF